MINEDLEVKLMSLNPTEFESLVKNIIDREYGNKFEYETIHIGKVLGEEKPKKGTPDIAFAYKNDRGKKIIDFVEITTRRFGLTGKKGKIEQDIGKCENLIRTEEIDVSCIIYACTSKITIAQQNQFYKHCKSFNCDFVFWGIDSIISKLTKYEDLSVSHLGVTLSSGNIKPLNVYLTEKKSGITEDNPFMFRASEREELIEALNKEKIVLVSGPSGCGKTRLAIEVAKELSKEEGCKAYWTQDCSSNINSDIAICAAKNKKSVIIIDDVNRKPSAIDALNFVMQYENIYIMLTIRDYALDDFQDKARDVLVHQMGLLALSYKEIRQIISDGFGIRNQRYLNYIEEISKGNLRFAIMTAEVITKKMLKCRQFPKFWMFIIEVFPRR